MKWLFEAIKTIDSWLATESPWYLKVANIVLTSGFHGLVTYGALRVGLGREAIGGYAFKEGSPVVSGLMRGAGRNAIPTGWRLADSISDLAVPLAVYFFLG